MRTSIGGQRGPTKRCRRGGHRTVTLVVENPGPHLEVPHEEELARPRPRRPAVFFGVTWTLQGIDVMKGSAMSGVTLWAVVGPIVALVGLVVLGVGIARRRRVGR